MLEALISLILTGIIVALSYSLYTLINKQMALFEKENTEIVNYNLFNTTIVLDINQSNDFRYTEGQLILKYYSNPDVIYNFENTTITRTVKGLNTDKFSVKVIRENFSEFETHQSNQLTVSLRLLNDTINANYFLKMSNSNVINKKLFNED